MGNTEMAICTHPRLPQHPTSGGPLPRPRPRCRARQLRRLPPRAAGHLRLLRRQGEPGARKSCSLLAELGSCFDCASRSARSSSRSPPARPPTASPSATPSRRNATSPARMQLGVRLFAVDCIAEVEKIVRAPLPAARVFCRILPDGAGAEWPLSRKFGCVPADGRRTCSSTAHRNGLVAYGVSFHVGSQQAERRRLGSGARLGRGACSCELAKRGIHLKMVNLGGGFPTQVPDVTSRRCRPMADAIFGALSQALRQPPAGDHHRAGPRHGRRRRHHQGRGRPDLEEVRRRPRSLGLSSTSASSAASPRRWTRRSATRSARAHDGDATEPCVLAGPTCDLGRRALREDARICCRSRSRSATRC